MAAFKCQWSFVQFHHLAPQTFHMDDDGFYLRIIDVPLVGAAPSVKRRCIVEKHTNDIEAIDVSENSAVRV